MLSHDVGLAHDAVTAKDLFVKPLGILVQDKLWVAQVVLKVLKIVLVTFFSFVWPARIKIDIYLGCV